MKNTTSMLFAALTLSFAGNALGANYPNKTIELVVPYAPGGTTDLVARIVASELGEVLGEPVVVLNRPGAGGAVGSGYAARQKPDGYTLVMAVESSHAVNPNVQAEPMYDPVKDFSPISNLVDVLGVLDVGVDSGFESFDDLLAELKDNPGQYTFGSSGTGGYSHLFGELFQSVTDTELLHVPYNGLGPALVDLMAGQVNVVFDNLPSSMSALNSGKAKPLAVAAEGRLESMPDIPTYAELGYPELNNPSWFGLAAPAGTPDEILDILNVALEEVLQDPKVVASIKEQGALPAHTSRKEFQKIIEESNERWAGLVKSIGFEKL